MRGARKLTGTMRNKYTLLNRFCFWIPSWPNLAARPTNEKPITLARRDICVDNRWENSKCELVTFGQTKQTLTEPAPQWFDRFRNLFYDIHQIHSRLQTQRTKWFGRIYSMVEELGDVSSATASKLATAKQKKDVADEAFKSGNVKDGAYLMLSLWTTSLSVRYKLWNLTTR